MTRVASVCFALFLAAGGPSAAQDTALAGEEVVAAVVGQSYAVSVMGRPVRLAFAADGVVQVKRGDSAKTVDGTWWLDGDALCLKLPRMRERCGAVIVDADGNLMMAGGPTLLRTE